MVLDYTSIANISPILWSFSGKTALHSTLQLSIHMKPHQKISVRLNITYKVTPEWHHIASEEPPENYPNTPDESLFMAKEELWPEPTPDLPQGTYLSTLCTLLAEPLNNFQSCFQKHPFINQRYHPLLPWIHCFQYLQNLSACWLQNAPLDPTTTRKPRKLPSRHIITPSKPAPWPAPGICYNSTPASPVPDLTDFSDDNIPLATERN